MSTIVINKRANYDYQILEKYEAGLVLKGYEVKSIKAGHISLKESFVTIRGNELYLTNSHITPYRHAGIIPGYDPTAPRKLLVKRAQMKSLIGKYRTQGLTLVPIRVYTKGRLIKLEFGLGKGKKEFDKRDTIKKKESDREIRRILKNSQ